MIHSGKGNNRIPHLYWGRDTALWEDEGMKIILKDKNNNIIDKIVTFEYRIT